MNDWKFYEIFKEDGKNIGAWSNLLIHRVFTKKNLAVIYHDKFYKDGITFYIV